MKYSVVHLITNSLVLTALNGGICIFGDYLVERNHESQILKAICDNTTHALIGLFSALIMILEANRRIGGIERISLIVICTIVSSFIDFDHFVVAKSIKLSKAVSIDRRPFLHFTTIPMALVALLIPLNWLFRSSRLNWWLGIVVCAFLSHHTRDATRRGYTLWPFGTTKPVPYPLYITFVMVMPFLMAKCLNAINGGHHRYQILEV